MSIFKTTSVRDESGNYVLTYTFGNNNTGTRRNRRETRTDTTRNNTEQRETH